MRETEEGWPKVVELAPHDPRWAAMAVAEGERLRAALEEVVLGIEHIGSTAIPGIQAKPVIDLLGIMVSLAEFDDRRDAVLALGYDWRGEYGIEGRRYCTRRHPENGRRLVHLHCFAAGSPHVTRHLAFRDWLRDRPSVAADYERVKLTCAARHPGDPAAYGDCKEAWIRQIESAALGSGTQGR